MANGLCLHPKADSFLNSIQFCVVHIWLYIPNDNVSVQYISRHRVFNGSDYSFLKNVE